MDAVELRVTSMLQSNEARYRVIYVDKNLCVLCMMDCSALNLMSVQIEELLGKIADGEVVVFPVEERRVVDISTMSPKAREKFNIKRNFIRAIEKIYAPTYLGLFGHDRKDDFIACLENFKLPKNSAWRYIRLYLQSGMDENVFLPKRPIRSAYQYNKKTGRKSDGIQTGIVVDKVVEGHFLEALECYKSGRAQSVRNAFDTMNIKHYMMTQVDADGRLVKVLAPASKRPTIRQFRYFVNKELSKEEKDKIKTSAQEQRNNKRLLLSDNLKNVMGPGDCIEIDEVEVDVSLVSQIDPEQVVGRPIVYAMIDVYTRAIVAASVAFDNNSVLGLTNCLMNLAEDKVVLCQQHGLQITQEMWPSCFIPRNIRADRGSEYRSKEAKRIFKELNINLELVPGGSGSLKGSIEQWFHQLHSAQNPLLENKGLIQKRYDSNHHEKATLTIEDFKRILYNFVITHNMKYMKKYPQTHDMIARKIRPIPSELWNYGVATYGNLRPISNKEHFAYTLLRPVEARISRRGITYKGLCYMDFADWGLRQRMYMNGDKSIPFDARIDPRNVGALYMLDRDGHLKKIPLNPERTGNNYQGVALAEYLELRKRKKQQDKLGEIYNEELRAGLLIANSSAIAESEENTPCYANTKNIRESRAVEKKLEATKLAIARQLENVSSPPMAIAQGAEERTQIEEKKEKVRIITDIDEAFDLFYGGDNE